MTDKDANLNPKQLGKNIIYNLAVSLLRKLPPALQVRAVRDTISMESICEHLPKYLLADLSLGAMSALPRIQNLVVDGALGKFEASACDRTMLPAYAKHGLWSPELHACVATRIFGRGSGGTFVDIGANIGLTCVPIAKKHGIACVAFEPDPTNYDLLLRNIARNDAGQFIVTHNMALSDTDGELALELSTTNLGDHRLRFGAHGADQDAFDESARRTINVPARRLDSLLDASQLTGPVLAKIDVQGAELHVLDGAVSVLDTIDAVVIEFWPYGLRRAGASFDRLFDHLRTFPYACMLHFDRNLQTFANCGLDMCDVNEIIEVLTPTVSTPDPDYHADILLSRASVMSALRS